MARPRQSEGEIIERLRRESTADGGDSRIDMMIAVEFNGEIEYSVGGRYDRRLHDFDGDAQIGVMIRPHPGQIEAFRWFARWLAVHAGRRDDPPVEYDEDAPVPDDEVFSSLHAGGRRGGKTWTDAVLVVMYAVMFSDAICWIVNASNTKHDEVRRYIGNLLLPSWVVRDVAEGWELINGSTITLKSAYVGSDPDAIKEGEAHVVWMNEGQKQAERVFVVARGAVVDHSGLVIVSANPPVEAKDQQWVADFAASAQRKLRAATYFHFNALENPHINRAGLLSLRKEVDIRTYRIEVLGEFLGAADAVAYNWDRTPSGNERHMPEPDDPNWVDVTSEFLEIVEEGDGLEDIAGLDVQVHPHIGGPVYRIYAPPGEVPTIDNVAVWGVDEIVVEGGDEVSWCVAAHDKGYRPDALLIVCDATGEYQHSRRRTTDEPPPDWKGKGSFDIIRGEGYWRIVPPSRRFRKKNPDIIDRIRAFTSMIENAHRKRRLFLDPDRCPMTCKSVREWPTVHGKPSRVHEAAHLGDGASYPIVRLFPRILRSGKPGLDEVAKRVDREQAVAASIPPRGFGAPPRVRRQGRPPLGL